MRSGRSRLRGRVSGLGSLPGPHRIQASGCCALRLRCGPVGSSLVGGWGAGPSGSTSPRAPIGIRRLAAVRYAPRCGSGVFGTVQSVRRSTVGEEAGPSALGPSPGPHRDQASGCRALRPPVRFGLVVGGGWSFWPTFRFLATGLPLSHSPRFFSRFFSVPRGPRPPESAWNLVHRFGTRRGRRAPPPVSRQPCAADTAGRICIECQVLRAFTRSRPAPATWFGAGSGRLPCAAPPPRTHRWPEGTRGSGSRIIAPRSAVGPRNPKA